MTIGPVVTRRTALKALGASAGAVTLLPWLSDEGLAAFAEIQRAKAPPRAEGAHARRSTRRWRRWSRPSSPPTSARRGRGRRASPTTSTSCSARRDGAAAEASGSTAWPPSTPRRPHGSARRSCGCRPPGGGAAHRHQPQRDCWSRGAGAADPALDAPAQTRSPSRSRRRWTRCSATCAGTDPRRDAAARRSSPTPSRRRSTATTRPRSASTRSCATRATQILAEFVGCQTVDGKDCPHCGQKAEA